MTDNEEKLSIKDIIKWHEDDIDDRKKLIMWRIWLIISGLMTFIFFDYSMRNLASNDNIESTIKDVIVMAFSGISFCISGSKNDKLEKKIKENKLKIEKIKDEEIKIR